MVCMRYWIFSLIASLPALAVMPPLSAAEVSVRITDQRGAPVADAIVTLTARGGAEVAPPARRPARAHVIDQKDETFLPYLEVFRTGDTVVFRNSDRTRHHVYSFAAARQFEFVLMPGESSQPLLLDKPGVVAVGCNIHDQMITYLYVSDAPFVARSGEDGHARIGDLPPGTFDVRAWQPLLRPGGPDNAQTVTMQTDGDAKTLAFALHLMPDPRMKADRERVGY
jgi:plastocyanin